MIYYKRGEGGGGRKKGGRGENITKLRDCRRQKQSDQRVRRVRRSEERRKEREGRRRREGLCFQRMNHHLALGLVGTLKPVRATAKSRFALVLPIRWKY